MRILKNMVIAIVILAIIGFVIPADIRSGYFYWSYGRVLELTGNTGGAADAYESAATAIPDSVKFARSFARTMNDLAEQLDDDGVYVEAYTFSREWINDHDNDSGLWQMWVELARAEWGRGRKTQARAAIDNAVDLQPTDYTALVYQGIIYRDQMPENIDMVRRAIPILEHAIAVRNHTRTYWAHYELSRALYMVNDEDGAIREVNQALSQFPPRWLRTEAERFKHEIQSSGRSER